MKESKNYQSENYLEIDNLSQIPNNFTGIIKLKSNGARAWLYNKKIHREDGPAIIHIAGQHKAWYFYGKRIDCKSTEEFLRLIKLKAFW